MTLEEFNYIAEIIASIAVIVSLLYVGVQVKHSAQAGRMETAHEIMSGVASFFDLLASNRELASIWHRGAFNIQDLDETERLRFTFAVARILRTTHEHFVLWRDGAIDAAVWRSMTDQFTDGMQLPGWQEVWSRRRHHFPKDFQDYVDKLIVEGEDRKPLYDPPSG